MSLAVLALALVGVASLAGRRKSTEPVATTGPGAPPVAVMDQFTPQAAPKAVGPVFWEDDEPEPVLSTETFPQVTPPPPPPPAVFHKGDPGEMICVWELYVPPGGGFSQYRRRCFYP